MSNIATEYFSHLINKSYEPYTMSEKQFRELEGLSSTELAEYDIKRIDEQLKNGGGDQQFYNQDVLKRIANKAYQECRIENGVSKCIQPGRQAIAGALEVAEQITSTNGEATCNDTYNLYKQHLDNILNIRFGGSPSMEYIVSTESCDGKCPHSTCLAQPACSGKCVQLRDLSYYAQGGKIGALNKNGQIKPVIVKPTATKPADVKIAPTAELELGMDPLKMAKLSKLKGSSS